MADVNPQRLQGIVASMLERQVQEMKAPPTGLIGGLWEKATGEIQKYNEAIEEHVRIKSKFDSAMNRLRASQDEQTEIQARLRDGLIEEGAAAEEARERLMQLSQAIDQLKRDTDDMAESVDVSQQSIDQLNEGGGILRNGLTALAVKVGGAAASFYGFRDAITSVDHALKLSSDTVGHYSRRSIDPLVAKSATYTDTLQTLIGVARDWHGVVQDTSWELMRYGINADEVRGIITSFSDGLRLTTNDQENLTAQTKQMTEDVGFLSKLLRVNTDELANATVQASKRFGKSTTNMADELAGLYVSIEQIKEGSRDSVISFSDLTRATLEAQSSFQGYNFNLRTTANVLGNVVAKAQEQGATYEMSMKAAEGLAGVITGGKAPDWAKYIAGRDMLKAARDAVDNVKKEGLGKGLREELGKQFSMKPEELKGLSDIQVQLAKQFGLDPTSKAGKAQLKGLENLTQNYKKYGALSSAKMAEELLRGTEQSNEAMFGMMKKMADQPEGRELLMRVWGLDEAAATAATLALNTAESVEDFTKIQRDAKKATADRKPPTAKDLKEQTQGFATAIGQAEAGIVGQLKNIFDAIRTNPFASGAIGVAGTVTSIGVNALQSGIGNMVGQLMAESKLGQAFGRRAGKAIGWARETSITDALRAARAKTTGRGPTVTQAYGAARGAAGRGAEMAGEVMTNAAGSFKKSAATAGTALKSTLSKAGKGIGTAMSALSGAAANAGGALAGAGKAALPLLGKAGLVGLAGAAGVAVGSLIRLIPGVDEFTEGLINSAAKMFGFESALDKAETAQAALASDSQGVRKALANVTAGITTDYEKDSLTRMKARVQLENATKEDLQAYAKKIAATGKLTEQEAMVRLESLASEKVDHDKLRRLREQETAKTRDAASNALMGVDTGSTASKLDRTAAALLTPRQNQPYPTEIPLVMPETGVPKTRLPSPSAMPESREARRQQQQREQERRRTRAQQSGRQPRTGGASVRPDGSINLNIMIPRDALDKSNTQSDGYVR